MIRSALFALLLAVTAFAQNCHPTISQSTTLNRGWFCSTITYCYTVCNPANCTLPIAKFCVDFPCGAGELDAGSITSPGNWAGAVDVVNNKVCWNATARASQIQPGQCKTFCITTNCNPRCIEGIQTAEFWAEFGVRIQNNVHTSFVLAGNHRSFLAGDDFAFVGSVYTINLTDASDPLGQDFLLASPFALPTGWQLPGLGQLYLDPILILPLAPIQLDALGHGQLQLPIPPDPALAGANLAFQAITLSPQYPRLSSDKVIQIR